MATTSAMDGNAESAAPFDAGRITHPALRRLHLYWRERSVAGRLPPRSIVDPIAMRPWLGNMTLMDVVGAPPRFRFRLCGSSFVERIGIDPTGRDLSALPDPEYRRRIEAEFLRIVATRAPSASRNRRCIARQDYDFEILRLPLADDGEAVSAILICPMYFRTPPLNYAVGTGRAPQFEAPTWLD